MGVISRSLGLKVLLLPQNSGKGAAVLHGLRRAAQEGFTHALTMDSDGQHPAQLIPEFMQRSQQQPAAMVLGKPVFDADAPRLRVNGRKVSNFWANLETGIDMAREAIALAYYAFKGWI